MSKKKKGKKRGLKTKLNKAHFPNGMVLLGGLQGGGGSS